ncbi:MAG: TIGR00270 family protein, partial [Thermoproteota archaeon]
MQRRQPVYCEMCGSPVEGRPFLVTIEGVEMALCERCYARYMSRSRSSRSDTPARFRMASPSPSRPASASTRLGRT